MGVSIAVGIVYLFLLLGAVAFVVCVAIPPWRRFALSAALWFAAWGLCCVVLAMVGILGFVAGRYALQQAHIDWASLPQRLAASLGWGFCAAAFVVTCAVATGVAWLHQAVIHRFTFALFRLYATAVCGGIGGVFGSLVCWCLLAMPFGSWLGALVILLLVALFGSLAYKRAGALRGTAPTRFTWITPEEFAGPVTP